MKLAPVVALCLTCAITSASEAIAAVPTQITVQGRVTDATGVALPAGTKTLAFRIFDEISGGGQIWPNGGLSEIQLIDTDINGLWSAQVGADLGLTEAVFAAAERWLEVTVSGTVLPRVRMVTGPFAFRVATVDSASGGTITSKVSIGDNHVNTGAHAFVAGFDNVASGTNSTVPGGRENAATHNWAVVGGGLRDSATAQLATVAGGGGNWAGGEGATVGGGQENRATGDWSTVAGGGGWPFGNTAAGRGAFVGGGTHNRAWGDFSVIGGGGTTAILDSNSAHGDYATIAGGYRNTASGEGSFIGGGKGHEAEAEYTAIVGGNGHNATAGGAFIGGGLQNTASNFDAVVAGGQQGVASGLRSAVLGGLKDSALGDYSGVLGGSYNSAGGDHSAVGGGNRNSAAGPYSVVAGGRYNRASGEYSFIGGGGGETLADSNAAQARLAVVVGGLRNIAAGPSSFIGCGSQNYAGDFDAAVVSGFRNAASGIRSGILGGSSDTASGSHAVILGGNHNIASGFASSILGGSENAASGNFSMSAGHRAKAIHHGSFVWGDSTAADVSSDANNQFKVRATNGMRLAADAGSVKTIAIGDNYRDNSVVAWGNVGAGGGVESDFGITSVVKGATGVYTINLDVVAVHPSSLAVVASPEIDGIPTSAATARILAVDQVDQNTFNVYITDGTWVGVDNEFTFIVMAR